MDRYSKCADMAGNPIMDKDEDGAWVKYEDIMTDIVEIGPNLKAVLIHFIDKMREVEVQHAADGIATIIKSLLVQETVHG